MYGKILRLAFELTSMYIIFQAVKNTDFVAAFVGAVTLSVTSYFRGYREGKITNITINGRVTEVDEEEHKA